MDTKTINWIRENIKGNFLRDVGLLDFFYKQRENKDYLNKVKKEIKKDISLVGPEFLKNREEELKYINYLIKN